MLRRISGRKARPRPLRWGLLFLFGLVTVPAAAQIQTTQSLDFGTLAVTANATPASALITPLGYAGYGSGWANILAGKPGQYRLTGYPAFTDISVSLDPSPLTLVSGTGETLTVQAAISNPTLLHTDQAGSVSFSLGATLTTSGDGQPYQDGAYHGQPSLNLSYVYLGASQVGHEYVNVDATLRSSLVLAQLQGLTFGKLAVFSSNADQASMTLSPAGLVSLHRPGAANLIRFGGELPATIQVTTGAPYMSVSIVLPAVPTYLVHSSLSPAIARLVVTNFTAQPVGGSAKLSAQGSLNFLIGATLSTEQTTKQYQDGVYMGTYDVSVVY